MPPPGIILQLAVVPFLASFLPFASLEEGVVLESRGASNFEDASTEALGGLARGRFGVPRMACACTTEDGVVMGAGSSVSRGGANVPEGDGAGGDDAVDVRFVTSPSSESSS